MRPEEQVTQVFQAHKPGQGKLSRTFILLAGLVLVAWAAKSLALNVHRIHAKLGLAWNEIFSDAVGDQVWRVDYVVGEGKFSPALTIALLVLVAGGLWLFWFLNRPAMADRLIDMEAELHKVSWPSFADAWQSTLVVSGFTALVVVLVFSYDFVIKHVIDLMPTGRN